MEEPVLKMTGVPGYRRRLYRMITSEVTQVEALIAMRQYLVRNLPTKYQKPGRTDSEAVGYFLKERREAIQGLCPNCIEKHQCNLLLVDKPSEFDLTAVDVSTLVVIVRFFLPFPPKVRPEPTNSIWTTRLKLLGSTGNLVNFVRLWRLWSKYKHNQMMNHSIPEIEADFRGMERAVLAISVEKTSLGRKLARFRHLLEMVDNENEEPNLRQLVSSFDSVAADLHASESRLESLLHQTSTLDVLLERAVPLAQGEESHSNALREMN